jgi:hypothetical protein
LRSPVAVGRRTGNVSALMERADSGRTDKGIKNETASNRRSSAAPARRNDFSISRRDSLFSARSLESRGLHSRQRRSARASCSHHGASRCDRHANLRHFPKPCLEKFGVRLETADGFLIQQYHAFTQRMLDKLDDQAIGIAQDRKFVVNSLRKAVPEFAKLVEMHL